LFLRKKQKEADATILDIGDHLLKQFEPHDVYQNIKLTIDRSVEMANPTDVLRKPRPLNIKEWATACARNISQEYSKRKELKRVAKEISASRMLDQSDPSGKGDESNSAAYLSELKLRMVYWDYFKIMENELIKNMHFFSDRVKNLEKETADPEMVKGTVKADEKIQKYIYQLEKQISQNYADIKKIGQKIKEYSRY